MQGLGRGVGGEVGEGGPRDTPRVFEAAITQGDAPRYERRLRLRSRAALASPPKASCVVASSWCRALCRRAPNGCLSKLCSAPAEDHRSASRTLTFAS